jgi:16S rRNA (guanine527-N7)-methyltransferase
VSGGALPKAAPDPPAAAAEVFGTRLPLAQRYAELLATAGVQRGLIGPREVSRLWERHLLNCAVLGELLDDATGLIDVGTGAGLPGMVLAVTHPELPITLIEPLARRVVFLEEAAAALGLANVRISRARAEELTGTVSAPVVTARAVAPLDRLARWTMPLVASSGRLLAVKGRSADEELATYAPAVRRLGGTGLRVVRCGTGLVDPPTTVICVQRAERAGHRPPAPRPAARQGRRAHGRGR